MFGLNIDGIMDGLEDDFNCLFVKFDKYKMVVVDEFYYKLELDGKDELVDIERDKYLIKILNIINKEE